MQWISLKQGRQNSPKKTHRERGNCKIERKIYHISKGKAVDASFADHRCEGLEDVVRVEEIPRPAVRQYACNEMSSFSRISMHVIWIRIIISVSGFRSWRPGSHFGNKLSHRLWLTKKQKFLLPPFHDQCEFEKEIEKNK